jgi:acyl-CoA synthetase (AMP-forming)/AMP-acid ligase II
MKPASLRELLETRAVEYPDKAFLFSECDSREWTYAAFDRAVSKTANMLKANGVEKGDVVSLLLPNSAEYVIAYFACWKVGALAGPVNSLLKAEEIEWVVTNSEAKLILIGADWSSGVSLTISEKHKSLPIVIFDDVEKAASDFSDKLEDVDLGFDDEAIIIYTSGTTGKPKGCLLTHGNLIANARQITEWMGIDPNDRLLSVMPLFHMNAVSVTTMSALYAGGSTVIASKFSASRFWSIIEKYRITSFGSVATMLSMLLSVPVAVESSLPKSGKMLDTSGNNPQPATTARGSDRYL